MLVVKHSTKSSSTTAGFEPTRDYPNWSHDSHVRVNHLNHSVRLPIFNWECQNQKYILISFVFFQKANPDKTKYLYFAMTSRGTGSFGKVLAMAILLAADLGLNCSLDYDTFNDQYLTYPNNFLLGLLGLQVIIEISIFLLLFLAMADTFLFRVGLLGLLLRKFTVVLLLHPLYICFTLAAGLVRVQRIVSQGYSLRALWLDDTFVILSSAQKTIAVLYAGKPSL